MTQFESQETYEQPLNQNQMNDEAAYFYRRWYELPNDEMIHPAAEQEIEAMEAYADYVLQSKINISDEEIEKQATNYIDSYYSQCTEEDRYVIALGFEKGAKWIRGRLLNKEI